jgi:hypothetical protein
MLKQLVEKLPSNTITKDGLKYLTRYYVFLKDRMFGNICIHHFHRSDMDMGVDGLGLLHCHPFRWAVSLVLSGGYREERRRADGTVYTRVVKPFTLNFISQKDFHRVDLLDENNGAWTIFLTGSRKNNSWGFWDRTTKEFIDWKKVAGAIE